MQQFNSSKEISSYCSKLRSQNLRIGFVPTMGALHNGHLSLVNASKRENDLTICSVFVNPTQFNDPKDFNSYPRTVDVDAKKLEEVDCDVLFAPTAKEIYPIPDQTIYELGSVANELEGEHRPGHFNGVASVVKRLFEIVRPHNAYFGLKDYQQYLVIKSLVKNYNLDVNIVGCPIIREENGLAMSSRNELLSGNDFNHAKILYQALQDAQVLIKNGIDSGKVSDQMTENLRSEGADVEYFEIRSSSDLSRINSEARQGIIALVAARFGKVRLIDNMILEQ